MKLISIVILTLFGFVLQAQVPVELEDEVIKIELAKNLVRVPVSSTATFETLGDRMYTVVNGTLELVHLEQQMPNILRNLYQKDNECKESLYILSSDLFARNDHLFCTVEMRAQYIQCDVPVVDYIKTSHRGTVTLEIVPILTKDKISVQAILVEHTMGSYLDYFIDQEKFLVVEESLPKSYSDYDLTLISSTFFQTGEKVLWNLAVSGKLTGEEIGILIQKYSKKR